VYLNASFNPTVNQGLVRLQDVLDGLRQIINIPEGRMRCGRALMEAWGWLQREGLIVREAAQIVDWYLYRGADSV
jgi:hypothetical protein